MKDNLLPGEMSLTAPQNPQSGAPPLGRDESRGGGKADCSLCLLVVSPCQGWCFGAPWCPSAPWAGWALATWLLVPGVPCWSQTRLVPDEENLDKDF